MNSSRFEAHLLYEEYEHFENSRQTHRQRKSKQKDRKNGRTLADRAELIAMSDHVDAWVPTYAKALDPKHHERTWVINSVAPFYQDQIITDVIRLVKGGKEANVYVCTADPASGHDLLAAKLYRPRMLRHLKNDAVYKAGRQLRDEEGKQLKGRRVKLAMRKKTDFGKQVDIMWWIGNEFMTQQKLYAAGADVPQPIGHRGNTILMAYIGDAYSPAPTLSEVTLPHDEAGPHFQRVMDNVSLMLNHHLVHGDLSAYNILYWNGRIQIIDFPQMVEARHNPHAYELLLRDITRVCDYFHKLGVAAAANPRALTNALWEPYMGEIPA